MSSSSAIVASNAETTSPSALVKMAYCYRNKYRLPGLTRLAPAFVGVHPSNRNGEPVSGERCAELIADILKMGFDPNEADSNAVCVQEKPEGLSIHKFNVQMCGGDEKLCAVLNGTTMQYGSLSHSHLTQGCNNILGECIMGIPNLCQNESKAASVEVLAEIDAEFAQYCRTGLLWEILSYKIEEEKPHALNIIQAACNCKHALALHSHETEALSGLGQLCKKASALAGSLAFDTAKEKLAVTVPAIAFDPDFIGMFRFVLELGGDAGPFIPDLQNYNSKFVNAKAGSSSQSVNLFFCEKQIMS